MNVGGKCIFSVMRQFFLWPPIGLSLQEKTCQKLQPHNQVLSKKKISTDECSLNFTPGKSIIFYYEKQTKICSHHQFWLGNCWEKWICRLGQATVVRPAEPSRRIISKRSGHKSEGLRMGAAFIPLILFTIIFAVVAILLPIFVPKNPYRG